MPPPRRSGFGVEVGPDDGRQRNLDQRHDRSHRVQPLRKQPHGRPPERVTLHYGTTSTATIPPSPSGTVATPLGTTQSVPSTRTLKWYRPCRSARVPSHRPAPRERSGSWAHWFQSPAIATERALSNWNRTTRLSPRRSGTSGDHLGPFGSALDARAVACSRTPSVTKPARGSP